MNQEIEEFVTSYLRDRGADIQPDRWKEFDFVASGTVDSFEILSFILVLNERYSINIKPEDFVGANYNRLGKLVEYIRHQAGASR